MKKVLPLLLVLMSAVGYSFLTAKEKPAEPAKVELPAMKFDDVKEIAPGVYFRYSSISATDKKVPFGGCNNTWVVFKDYVVVLDANFPKEAADVIAAIKKTTVKPIKYVFDTHHHGDHAYGNTIWAKAGAKVIGQTNCARLLKTNGPAEWEKAGKDRKDIKDNELKTVDEVFEDKFVLDDGTQRIEFYHFGHAHTSGDAMAYLPKHKIICTGDACVNGAFNFMGHSNSASWIKVLQSAEKLDINIICPGHGPLAGKELLGKQRRYFEDMRAAVQKGIKDKKTPEQIAEGLDMPWYKEWTGIDAKTKPENVKHVYDEMTGKIDPSKLGWYSVPKNDAKGE